MTQPKSKSLQFYKVHDQAQHPVFSTGQSACFDIYSCFAVGENIQYFNPVTTKQLPRSVSTNGGKPCVQINNMERMLIPTGLIFNIPAGYSVRLHSRSGLAFKSGIYLTNCEGIIDSDYTDPIFAMMTNISNVPVKIFSGDRICQGELIRSERYTLDESDEVPTQKTNREGGFGSTGV